MNTQKCNEVQSCSVSAVKCCFFCRKKDQKSLFRIIFKTKTKKNDHFSKTFYILNLRKQNYNYERERKKMDTKTLFYLDELSQSFMCRCMREKNT